MTDGCDTRDCELAFVSERARRAYGAGEPVRLRKIGETADGLAILEVSEPTPGSMLQ